MKFYIFPENSEAIVPAFTGIDINRQQKSMTIYINIHLDLWGFFSHRCAVKSVIEELAQYMKPRVKDFRFLRENEKVHDALHNNEGDKKDITHIHIKFDKSLDASTLVSVLNVFRDFQEQKLSDGTKPILIPNINKLILEMSDKITANFDSEKFDDEEVQLNCTPEKSSQTNKHRSICPPKSNFFKFRKHPRYEIAQRHYRHLPEKECTPIQGITMMSALGITGAIVAAVILLALLCKYLNSCGKSSEKKKPHPALARPKMA